MSMLMKQAIVGLVGIALVAFAVAFIDVLGDASILFSGLGGIVLGLALLPSLFKFIDWFIGE